MTETADLVIVGAGTVGGWASVFAAAAGAAKVIVLEKDIAGAGASSRAAGQVRAQGGTPVTIELGRWSIDFYRAQRDRFGVDSGFRELGYLILADTEEAEAAGRARVDLQRANGLDAVWVGPAQACSLSPTLSPEGHRGGSYLATDGHIDPVRNVRAYSIAMAQAGVELREGTEFLGLSLEGNKVVGVETSVGPIATESVLLTGGPSLQAIGKLVGARVPVGAARHQVVVSEPHPAFQVERQAMVFDLGAGLYWRLEESGLLWGMSNPNEKPGPAFEIDWEYLRAMEERLHRLVPVTEDLGIRKAWCATIEYTPDHLPIFGAVITRAGDVLDGATLASSCGHGMMWGPAVAQVAADLATEGRTDVIDPTDLGLDRFDERGGSPFSDPVALPFPVAFDEDDADGVA